MFIPSSVLKRVLKEVKLESSTLYLELTNPLMNVTITRLEKIAVDDDELPQENVILEFEDKKIKLSEVREDEKIPFNIGSSLKVVIKGLPIDKGKHIVKLNLKTREFGTLDLKFDVEV